MLLLLLTMKHDGCFIPLLGQHLQARKTPNLRPEDEDETFFIIKNICVCYVFVYAVCVN